MNIVIPTIHRNGTSQEDLLTEPMDAISALRHAIDKLPNPNGRDYYPQGDDKISEAIGQERVWRSALQAVLSDLERYAEGIFSGGKSALDRTKEQP